MNKIHNAKTLDFASQTPKSAPAKAAGIQIHSEEDESNPLTDTQQQMLAEGENDIQENLRGTFVLGWRLEQIRDQQLYRSTHKTFDAYCRKRWDFSKTHANRHIQAYVCEKHLKGLKDQRIYVPNKESQVRYIADLSPEQQVAVATKVRETVGDNAASAGDFGAARQELFPITKPDPKPKKATITQVDLPRPTTLPSEFDTKLVSFSELKNMADTAYSICGTKPQEALKVIGKLQRHLGEWAKYQSNQTGVA